MIRTLADKGKDFQFNYRWQEEKASLEEGYVISFKFFRRLFQLLTLQWIIVRAGRPVRKQLQ